MKDRIYIVEFKYFSYMETKCNLYISRVIENTSGLYGFGYIVINAVINYKQRKLMSYLL